VVFTQIYNESISMIDLQRVRLVMATMVDSGRKIDGQEREKIARNVAWGAWFSKG